MDVQYSNEKGFQFKAQLVCSSCKEIINESYSSPQQNDIVDINLRMTSAFLDSGAGYTGIQKLGMDLNMNVMSDATFTKYVNIVHEKHEKLRKKTRDATLEAVRRAHVQLNPALAKVKILNVAVSYDGSWHTRVHSSNVGIGVVIDVLTGLVLDYVVLSKYCTWCSLAEKSLERIQKSLTTQRKFIYKAESVKKTFSDHPV